MSFISINRRFLFKAISAVAATALVSPAVAAAPTVALSLQGVILAKALNYDQSLQRRSPKVLVIAKDVDANARRVAAAFSKLGADVRTTARASLGKSDVAWADAAYVFSGQLTTVVRGLCVEHGVLSLSESAKDVEAGRASAAVGADSGKPQLIINVRRVEVENHRFSSRLLKLARVIR